MRAVGAGGSGELGLEDLVHLLAMQAAGGCEGVQGPWEDLGRGATGATHAGEAVWGREYRGGATFGEAAVTSGGGWVLAHGCGRACGHGVCMVCAWCVRGVGAADGCAALASARVWAAGAG